MDIIVFGSIVTLFAMLANCSRERDLSLSRQMKFAEYFKKCNVDETRFRTAGALRRLNRLSYTAIDFAG